MEDRWPSSCFIMKCKELVILLSKASDELQPGQEKETLPWPQHDWYAQRCSTCRSQRGKSWLIMGHLGEQCNVLVWVGSGQVINMQNLILSWYLLIAVIVTLVWERKIWGPVPLMDAEIKPVKTGPSPDEGLTFLYACQKRTAISEYIKQLYAIGCGWFLSHLGQNFWVWPVLIT